MSDAPVVLRDWKPSDRNFVIDSWVRSYRGSTSALIPESIYFDSQRRLINALLERCQITIAGFDEDPDTILGWACTSSSAIHYVWVRPQFRKQGIAKAMLAQFINAPAVYTHKSYAIKKPPTLWSFDPYHAFELAYRKQDHHEVRKSA
jgi:hypothetical protein